MNNQERLEKAKQLLTKVQALYREYGMYINYDGTELKVYDVPKDEGEFKIVFEPDAYPTDNAYPTGNSWPCVIHVYTCMEEHARWLKKEYGFQGLEEV